MCRYCKLYVRWIIYIILIGISRWQNYAIPFINYLMYLFVGLCLNLVWLWMSYLICWSLLISHVYSWVWFKNTFGDAGLYFPTWTDILLLNTMFLFQYQLCLMSTVTYHIHPPPPWKLHKTFITFSCNYDGLQP